MADDGGLGEAIEAAEEMLAEGAVADAAQTFAAILGEEPENAAAMAGLARAHIAMEQLDQAEALLNNAPEVIANAPRSKPCVPRSNLPAAANAGPLRPSFPPPSRPIPPITRRDSTMPRAACVGTGRRGRGSCWNCSAVTVNGTTLPPRRSFSQIFDALKPQDPIALNGRRKLELDDICLIARDRLGRVS
jgi:putative thioredoxin